MRLRVAVCVLMGLTCATISVGQQSGSTDSTNEASETSKKQTIAPVKTTVIVTATRTEVDTDKAPASTSVIPESEIKARNTILIDQSLNTLPGVILTRTKGMADSMPAVGLRGFGGSGSSQSRVLVLLDGEPLNDGYTGQVMWSAIPTSEINRVEVVRGPFSALYGGNAMGGVINILTRPVDKRHFELNSQFGSQNTGDYSADYSERFFDKLGVAFGYQREQTVGYPSTLIAKTASSGSAGTAVSGAIATTTTTGAQTFIIGNAGHNWYHQNAYRGRAEYAFNSKTSAYVQYIRQQWDYGYGHYESYLRDASGNTVKTGTVNFMVNGVSKQIKITPYSFMPSGPGGGASNFYHARILRALSDRQTLEFSGGMFDLPISWYTTPGTAADYRTGAGTYANTASRSWHANALWSISRTKAGDILVGMEFRRARASSVNFNATNYSDRDTTTTQTYAAAGKSNTYAVYAQDQYQVMSRLQVVAGGRMDHWSTFDGGNNSFGTSVPVSYPSRSETSYNGKLSALYSASDSTILRASVGNAFHSPTVYNLYRTWVSSSGITYQSNPYLKPEHILSWEFGVRQKIGNRIKVEGTYYENHVSDLIYSSTTGTTNVTHNAGKSRTRGLELSGEDRLLSWLTFSASYTFNDAVITENALIPASIGKQVTYVPRNAATGMLMASWKRWSGTLSERTVGHIYASSDNSNMQTVWGVPTSYDGYSVVGASVNYDINKHFTVYGSVDNLLDRYYYQYYVSPGRSTMGGLRFHL
jgi:iron complex outermembrane recepter protein